MPPALRESSQKTSATKYAAATRIPMAKPVEVSLRRAVMASGTPMRENTMQAQACSLGALCFKGSACLFVTHGPAVVVHVFAYFCPEFVCTGERGTGRSYILIGVQFFSA